MPALVAVASAQAFASSPLFDIRLKEHHLKNLAHRLFLMLFVSALGACAPMSDPNTKQGCYEHAKFDSGICGLGCPVMPRNTYEQDLASQCRSRCSQDATAAYLRCDRLRS